MEEDTTKKLTLPEIKAELKKSAKYRAVYLLDVGCLLLLLVFLYAGIFAEYREPIEQCPDCCGLSVILKPYILNFILFLTSWISFAGSIGMMLSGVILNRTSAIINRILCLVTFLSYLFFALVYLVYWQNVRWQTLSWEKDWPWCIFAMPLLFCISLFLLNFFKRKIYSAYPELLLQRDDCMTAFLNSCNPKDVAKLYKFQLRYSIASRICMTSIAISFIGFYITLTTSPETADLVMSKLVYIWLLLSVCLIYAIVCFVIKLVLMYKLGCPLPVSNTLLKNIEKKHP